MRLANRTITSARLHPALRCVCGCVVTARDLDVIEETRIRLICGHCGRQLLEIPISIINDEGQRW